MLLYRFFPLEYALEALEQRCLRVGKLNQLNDPFDCFPRIVNLPSNVQGFEFGFQNGMLDTWSNKFGIICYSTAIYDPVIWSHYSSGHHGVALGFDIPLSDQYVEVTYSNKRPELDYKTFDSATSENVISVVKTIMFKKFSVKAPSWSYEKEYRQFLLLESCTARKGMYYTELPLLNCVVLGARCSINIDYFKNFLLQSNFGNVKILKATRSDDSYKIVLHNSDRM